MQHTKQQQQQQTINNHTKL